MTTVRYFKALADHTRLRLFRVLLTGEYNVGELTDILDLGQPRVSRHLRILADSGLAASRRDGLWVFYSADVDGPARRAVRALAAMLDEDPGLAADLEAARRARTEREGAVTRFFNGIAPDWDRLMDGVLAGFDLHSAILDRVPACEVAADLGCGTGRLLERLADRARCVIGVDASPGMLDKAARLLGGDGAASLRIGRLEHLPLGDGEAQAATMSLALHHLPEPAQGLREAARVLAPGGVFVLADFLKHGNESMRTAFGDRWLGFAEEEVFDWLEQAGFRSPETARFPVDNGLTIGLYRAEKR